MDSVDSPRESFRLSMLLYDTRYRSTTIQVIAVIAFMAGLIFGALGVAGYLGYLSSRVFHDSLGFTFALTVLGLAVVAFGVWWQRHEAAIHARLAQWLPAALRPLGQAG